MKRLTIHDIKRLTADTAPYFFTRETLRFFGQRMRDFSVYKLDNGQTWEIVAPIRDYRGQFMRYTRRYFDVASRNLLTDGEYNGRQSFDANRTGR